MVFGAGSGEADFDAAKLVAMYFLAFRADYDGALHLRLRQVGARVIGGNDCHAAPHGSELNVHAQRPLRSLLSPWRSE